jgi:DegV family protein with EDD domain
MDFQHLTPQHLLQAIISGCEHLKLARKKLNDINFFPVADGDTGDNMAATAHAIIENASLEPTVHQTLESVANASIIGARGNSGMLFSSFFNGLFQAAQQSSHLNTHHFGEMLNNAAKQVRSSLIEPMEGTLLTVVESWASLVKHRAHELTNFKTLCQDILHPLKNTLDESCHYTHKNEERVLDAGALGFYHFIEGFTQSLGNEENLSFVKAKSVEEFHVPDIDHVFTTSPPSNRFCTEALLRDTHINPQQLKRHLQQFGDSIVVTGHQHLQRFHIHTNTPARVFDSLQALGRIANPKVDDMQRQYECHLCTPPKIGLLTDSCADLPLSIRDQFKIHLLPINIHLAEHHLLDPYSIEANHFYHQIKKTTQYPTTSAPNPLQIQNKFKELQAKNQDLLMITVADRLSSTFASASNIAKEYDNIHVVNSKLTSAAQSLLVHHAALRIQEGDIDVKTLSDELSHLNQDIVFYVLVNKLDALMRSGRVDKIKGNLANLLHLKPIIKLNSEGRGSMDGQAFTIDKGLQSILRAIEKEETIREKRLSHYAIVHAGFEEGAKKLSEHAEFKFSKPPLYIGPVSAAIGLHAGYGCVGIAAMFQ